MPQAHRECKGGMFKFKREEAGGKTGEVIEKGRETFFLPTFKAGYCRGGDCLAAGRMRLESCAQAEVL